MLTHSMVPTLTEVTAQPRPRAGTAPGWAPDPQRQALANYTVEDLLALPDEAPRTELRDGVLIPVPAPTAGHQRVVGKLWREIEDLAPTGFTVLSAVGIMINQHNTFEPDIVILSGLVEDTHHFFPPGQCVVAVEVVSPSTKRRDRDEKPGLYAAAGVPHYWRIEQGPTEIYAYDLVDGRYELAADTTEDGRLALYKPFGMQLDARSL